jgi:hypothetical protein
MATSDVVYRAVLLHLDSKEPLARLEISASRSVTRSGLLVPYDACDSDHPAAGRVQRGAEWWTRVNVFGIDAAAHNCDVVDDPTADDPQHVRIVPRDTDASTLVWSCAGAYMMPAHATALLRALAEMPSSEACATVALALLCVADGDDVDAAIASNAAAEALLRAVHRQGADPESVLSMLARTHLDTVLACLDLYMDDSSMGTDPEELIECARAYRVVQNARLLQERFSF